MSRHHLIALLLIVLTLAVFWPVRDHEFVWDDNANVEKNPYLSPVTLPNILSFWQRPYERLYVPLTYTVWAAIAPFASLPVMEEAGQKLDPQPFHIANLILHLLSVLAVFAILRTLVRNDWAAGGGALLFALHPVQVEPVAWVTGMKDLLSGFLSLVALWQYLAYAVEASAADKKQTGRRDNTSAGKSDDSKIKGKDLHYSIATLAFVLALLAKPAAVVVPVAAWVLDYWVVRRSARRSTAALVGWMAVAAPFVVLTKWAQPDADIAFIAPLWARPLVAADVVTFYLYKLAVPLWLGPDYGRSPELVLRQGWIYLTWAAPCGLAVLLWLWRERRPWLVAAAAVFVIGVLPVSGLIPFRFQNYSTVADRYLYLSMLGPALAVSWYLAQCRERLVAAAVVCVVILGLLGITSAFQTQHWHDNTTLFNHALRVNSNSWIAHNNLGVASVGRGELEGAIGHFRQALRINPAYAEAHHNLGYLLSQRGEFGAAVEHYRQALKFGLAFAEVHFNLGNALAQQGDLQAAMDQFREALKIDPDRAEAYHNLGRVEAAQGELDRAIEHFRQAVRLQPEFAEAHESLGRALALQGQRNEAVQHYQEALRIMKSRREADAPK